MNISIIIPTFNRPDKLKRALAYYAKYNVTVFVADGSNRINTESFNKNVVYYYLPSMSFARRVKYVLDNIDDQIVCLAADDDFVSPEFLCKASEKLSEDPRLVLLWGDVILQGKNPKIWKRIYINAKSINDSNLKFRIVNYFESYFPVFYAPIRKKTLNEIFAVLVSVPDNYAKLSELIFSLRVIIDGKIIFLDEFCMAREYPDIYLTGVIYPNVEQILTTNSSYFKEVSELTQNWFNFDDNFSFDDVLYSYAKFTKHYNKLSNLQKIKKILRNVVSETTYNYITKFYCFFTDRRGEVQNVIFLEDQSQITVIEDFVQISMQNI